MEAAATLVWLAPDPPDAEQARALSSWSRSHGVRLAPPSDARAPRLSIDLRIAETVETLLERARDAIAARDGAGAEAALSTAESTLRAHAELPQAAWLMAEVERARAARWRRIAPTDEEAALEAWLRAEALDGGRVAGALEEDTTSHPQPATVALALSPEGAGIWLDGKPLQAPSIATLAGPHVLVLTWAGAPVWAGWIETPTGSSTVRVSAEVATPCSGGDVSRARGGPGSIEARHVRCPTWIAAVPGEHPGGVDIAMCEADRCGLVFEWHAPARVTWPAADQAAERSEREKSRWPAWATWGLVGAAGAAVAAGVLVLGSGVLQATPTETRFVNGGIRSK
jgi:hypothetical protein